MIESLQSIFDELGLDIGLDKPWQPVSHPVLVGWLIFYVGFLGYALHANGGMLFIDLANLVVHEGGHNLFRWFGPRSAYGEARCCSGWCRFCLRHTSILTARPADSFSACSFSSRTGSTLRPTWRTREPRCCLWSPPEILNLPSTISFESSAILGSSATTRKLPPSFAY